MKIALDAGHGLHTAGKRTPDDIREWTLNNTVLLGFEKEIKKYKGVEVLRLDDPSGLVDIALAYRTNNANSWGADYLISFHHNAYQSKWGNHGGTEVWVQDDKSRELANVLLRSTVETLGLRNRGIKVGNLHMNRESKMPSVLVELGFMDSNTDKVIRDENKRELAGVRMAQAFATHYKLPKVETPTEVPTVQTQAPKPAPKKKYITLTGRVDLYDDNSKKYPTPSGKTRKVEVLDETQGWYKVRSNDFTPRDVWVKKQGAPVVKPAPQPVKNKPSGAWKAEDGVFILSSNVYERNQPKTSDKAGMRLITKGKRYPYDAYQVAGGYVWLRNKNTGKVIPWRVHNGEKWGRIV